MVSLWIIIGLAVAASSVASLAAFFSVVGIGALFSGAWLAVCAMASSLEIAKFVLAAYLHQQWGSVNKIFRSYLVFAIIVLSVITSMGVFGFLSDAYQSASSAIEAENIKLQTDKNKQATIKAEIARINQAIDEIPATRISRKIRARAEAEPAIQDLNKRYDELEKNISVTNLKVLEIKKKVGPLVYIARAFNIDIDTTVKYLIFIFVLVFDPLAICLVIALTEATDSRRRAKLAEKNKPAQPMTEAPPTASSGAVVVQATTPIEPVPAAPLSIPEPAAEKTVYFETTQPAQTAVTEKISTATAEILNSQQQDIEQEDLIEMRYADEDGSVSPTEPKDSKKSEAV